ncbi:MAG: hypothetical protein VX498_10460 [Myxococcota bacterium]|nr:hypothetical protein [Myxococcota bacterium]
MIRRSFLLVFSLALLFPSAAQAEPTALDLDSISRRWLGPQYLDNLGWRIAAPGDLNGDGLADFAVSAPQDDGPLTFNSVVRIYFGRSTGAPSSGYADWADVEVSDGKVGTDAVYQFAFIDDATGDGVGDLLVVEPTAGAAGKVLLYPGSAADWPSSLGAPDAVARWDGYLQEELPELAGETRPSQVAGGDFDGDGLADIVIASELFSALWVDYSDSAFSGTSSLQDLGAPIRLCSDEVLTAQFGAAVVAGDFNGDDFADLAVSAPGCVAGEGRVFVWYGASGGLAAEPDLTLGGRDRLGGSLTVLDMDGDGIDDLAVQELLSATEEDPNAGSRGNLLVYFGGEAGLPESPAVSFLGGFSDRRFGEAVALLADTSTPADGVPELVISSPEAAYNGLGQGAVYIFDGRAEWSGEINASEARYRISGAHRDAWLGHSLATLDDFDGNGYPELVIGEPNYTEGKSENDYLRGRVYFFDGLPDRDEDGDGISTLNGDCEDLDPDIGPLSAEECGDGLDNDCDHEIDEGCGDDDDDDDDLTPPPAGDDDDDDEDDGGACDCSSGHLSWNSAGPGSVVLLLVGLLGLVGLRRRSAA